MVEQMVAFFPQLSWSLHWKMHVLRPSAFGSTRHTKTQLMGDTAGRCASRTLERRANSHPGWQLCVFICTQHFSHPRFLLRSRHLLLALLLVGACLMLVWTWNSWKDGQSRLNFVCVSIKLRPSRVFEGGSCSWQLDDLRVMRC